MLEEAYRRVRASENELDLDDLPPAMPCGGWWTSPSTITCRNHDFIRLVMIENIHHGELPGAVEAIQQLNVPAIDELDEIYRRGVGAGVFRAGLIRSTLHWQISALCFFNVSNRATFSRIFGDGLTRPSGPQASTDAHVV